ncbi:putative tape measure domain of caudovirus [Vitreoscilla sp. C1]|nr:putative tape measure domain of caudovirus [Vitreoscilla sp. C1]
MSNAVERQIDSLKRQFNQLKGTTDEFDRLRASSRGATLEQRNQIESILQLIDAEKKAQAAAAEQAQAQKQALLVQQQRASSVANSISALDREVKTFGMSSSEIRVYEMQLNGASAAELVHASNLNRKLKALQDAKAAQIAATQAQKQALLVQQQRTDSLNKSLSSIERERQAIGKTSIELRLHELRLQGATQKQLARAEASLKAVEADRKQQQSLLQANQAAGNLNGTYQSVIGSLKAMALGYVSLQGAASLMRAADAYQGLENRLRLVTSSQLELNQAMQDTKNIALQTSMQWESVASIYQRFAQNGEKLGLTMKETADLTSTVAKTAMISGGSMDSVNAALVQFGQALASGVLRGEEFNSIAEQQPALLQAIAKSLGVNIGQLRFMAADGILTADVVAKALQDAAASVDKDFGKMQQTGTQALQNLSTRWTEFIGETGKNTGAMKAFTSVVGLLGENLDTVAVMAFASGLAYLGKATWLAIAASKAKIATLLAERQATIASTAAAVQATHTERLRAMAELNAAQAAMAHAVGTNAQTLASANLAAATARATAATVAETIASNAAAVATSRLAAAKTMLIGAMGGPAGIVVAGVAVAGMYAVLSSDASTATSTLQGQVAPIEELTEKLKGLNEEGKLRLRLEIQSKLNAANEELDDFESRIKNLKHLSYLSWEDVGLNPSDAFTYDQGTLVEKSYDRIKAGISSVEEELLSLQKTGELNENQMIFLNKAYASMFEPAQKNAKDLNEQMKLLDGKKVTATVDLKTNTDDKKASLTSAQALDFDAIKKVSDEFALMHANLGLSNEELKLAAVQQNLANLAAKGASAETMRAAELNAQLMDRHYIEMQTKKQLNELREAEARLLEQNHKFVADELGKREQQIWQLGKTTEQLTAMSLAAKGATEAEQRKAMAMDRLISEYERQRNAMQTLEDMNKEIARLGKSDTEVKLMDLKDKGATAEQLALYKQQLEYAEQFKEAQKLNEAAVKADGKAVTSFTDAVRTFDQSVKNQADLEKLSRYERNKQQWAQIRAEEQSKNQMTYYGPSAWYSPQTDETGKKTTPSTYPNTALPKQFTEQVSKMSNELNSLGVLYLASQDSQADMARVLVTPENAKIIKQIAQAGFKDMARDGAAKSS